MPRKRNQAAVLDREQPTGHQRWLALFMDFISHMTISSKELDSTHPVPLGDVLYGAPRQLRSRDGKSQRPTLARNFLHAAALEFHHPSSGRLLSFLQPLPPELEEFLAGLRAPA